MRPIQPILILLLLLGVGLYLRGLRSHLFGRLLVLGSFVGGIGLIAFPDLANRLAWSVGVGRGVDVVIYVSIAGIVLFLIRIVARLREQETQITELARALALASARIAGSDRPVG